MRPRDSGTDEDVLQTNFAHLSEGHNKLIEVLGRHEIFLSPAVIDTLDGIGRVVRMELLRRRARGFLGRGGTRRASVEAGYLTACR